MSKKVKSCHKLSKKQRKNNVKIKKKIEQNLLKMILNISSLGATQKVNWYIIRKD